MRSGLDEDYLFVFAAPVDSVEEEEVSADVAFAVIGQVHGERAFTACRLLRGHGRFRRLK